MTPDQTHVIASAAGLDALYDAPIERSLRKQLDRLDDRCRAFIAASPLLIIGTQSAAGIADNSPRGDHPGFVTAPDDHTLLIPDRRGNNRLDTLHNIVENPAVGLLFLIPGLTQSFRVNGHAVISTDPALLAQFTYQGKQPRTVMIVKVQEAYVQCSRALVRADVWSPAKQIKDGECSVPTFGAMLEAHTRGFVDGKALDEENKTRIAQTLY